MGREYSSTKLLLVAALVQAIHILILSLKPCLIQMIIFDMNTHKNLTTSGTQFVKISSLMFCVIIYDVQYLSVQSCFIFSPTHIKYIVIILQ